MDFDAYLFFVDWVGVFAGVGFDFSVLEDDAVTNLLYVVCGDVLVEVDVIDLLLQELWMGELRRHVAIVGEEEDSCGIAVETSYWVYSLFAAILDEVHNGFTLLWVVGCGYIVLWFVEEDVDFLLKADGLVVELYLIGA